MRTLHLLLSMFTAGLIAGSAVADQTVYVDGLQNSWQNFSYGPAGSVDFANATPFHDGAPSIRLTGNNFNAISFAHTGQNFSVSNFPRLRFWAHGGASGGQQLRIVLQLDNALVAQAELDASISGGALVAGQWREANVDLAALLGGAGTQFDRIDLQSDVNGTQPALYVDDVLLLAPPPVGGDPLFGNGFEDGAPPGPTITPLLQEQAVTVGGMVSERFSWRDANLQPRSAVLAHNNGQSGPGGSRGGELRELRYEIPGGTRIVRASSSGAAGFGYVVAHPDGNGMACRGGDSSSLGHFTSGAFQRIFTGRHHAIFRFTQNYPRLCQVGATPPAANIPLPVTLDWIFSSGRDHPLLALTWDMNAIAVNTLRDDVRGPYGELLFDGAASEGAHSVIAGVGWGDRYKFATTSAPVTLNSSWTWNTPNTIPYVKLWTTAVDASMGTVLTQTIAQQDAGGYFGANRWDTTSAAGNACTIATGGVNHLLPCNYNWPYQSINYSLSAVNTPTNNTRLAWGSNFGFLGQSSYFVHGSAFWGGPLPNASAPGWPRKSYSTFVVLDRHSVDPVAAVVSQIETAQNVTLSATVGTVASSGPAGVNRPDTVTYSPAGYDPVYSAWAVAAATNQIDLNFAVAAGTLKKPLLIVRGYSAAAAPASVRLNGALLTADSGYFASLRSDAQELWITVNADFNGAVNRLQVSP